MCSAESPGPQVVHGKLAANLAAAANWPHLSSLGWLFLPCSFPSASPGRITARGGGRAVSDNLLAAHTGLGLWAQLGSVPHPGLSPLYRSLSFLGSNRTWHNKFPDPGSSWLLYWGKNSHFLPLPPQYIFFLLSFELTETIG